MPHSLAPQLSDCSVFPLLLCKQIIPPVTSLLPSILGWLTVWKPMTHAPSFDTVRNSYWKIFAMWDFFFVFFHFLMIIWMWDIFELSIFQSDSPCPLLILLKFQTLRNFKEWVSDTGQEHMNPQLFSSRFISVGGRHTQFAVEMGDTWLQLTNWKKNLLTA